MNDHHFWVQQKVALAKCSDADEFVNNIIVELKGLDLNIQGDTFLELASVLRGDLIFDKESEANTQLPEIIFKLLKEAEKKLPGDPLPPMLQATFLFYNCNDPERACPHALRAVKNAQQSLDMVRQTTGELIRIYIALNNHQAVEPLLVSLLKYEPGSFSMEIPLESDFLARLPMGSVNPSIIDAYRVKAGLS